jgi:hypothetical protein
VVNDLERFFYASNCNSLHGKPKIFLIDACRGTQTENAFDPVSISGMTTREPSTSLRCLNSIAAPSDSVDFLIIYATTDGNISYTTIEGSNLIQAFVEVTSKARTKQIRFEILLHELE